MKLNTLLRNGYTWISYKGGRVSTTIASAFFARLGDPFQISAGCQLYLQTLRVLLPAALTPFMTISISVTFPMLFLCSIPFILVTCTAIWDDLPFFAPVLIPAAPSNHKDIIPLRLQFITTILPLPVSSSLVSLHFHPLESFLFELIQRGRWRAMMASAELYFLLLSALTCQWVRPISFPLFRQRLSLWVFTRLLIQEFILHLLFRLFEVSFVVATHGRPPRSASRWTFSWRWLDKAVARFLLQAEYVLLIRYLFLAFTGTVTATAFSRWLASWLGHRYIILRIRRRILGAMRLGDWRWWHRW